MFKIMTGLLATSGLIGQMVISPMLASPDQIESSNVTDWETMKAPLVAAQSNITDKDTAAYYQKLVQGYELDTPVSGQEEAIPDFYKITSVAMTLPLTEAGKQFTDPDLARFYYKLLGDAGFDIK